MEGRLSCPWSEFQRGRCVGDCVDGLCLNSQSIIAVSFRESVGLQMWAQAGLGLVCPPLYGVCG